MSDNLYNLLALGDSDNYKVNLQITRIFDFTIIAGQLNWTMNSKYCDERVNSQLAKKLSPPQVLSTQCIMRVFEDGPKYLSMKAKEFEALENTDLTIPIVEYKQPFPVVCFPIPENYARDRFVSFFGRTRIPKYCIIWQRPDAILMTIIYDRDFIWATPIVAASPENTFEQKLEKLKIENPKAIGTQEDYEVMKQIIRACLNGALVFDQVKTTSFTTRRGKKPHKTDAVYYSFDQSVRLYSREGGEHDSTGEGSAVRCHWRRGHWRLQAHGVGLGLRKRIRIAPVLVRRDLFAGDLSNTTVNYVQTDR